MINGGDGWLWMLRSVCVGRVLRMCCCVVVMLLGGDVVGCVSA